MATNSCLVRVGPIGIAVLLLAGPVAADVTPEPAASVQAGVSMWPAVHRFQVHTRPFGRSDTGGLITDLGYEYIDGINVGVELSPITIGPRSISSFAARLKLGYGGRSFAAGATVSSGYPAWFPELGVAFRIGRLDRTFFNARVAWLVSPAVWVPMDATFELRVPLAARIALRVDAYGGYTATHPFIIYGSVGIGYTLRGGGLTNTTILNVGAGPVYFGTFGGAALIGVEHRL